MPDVQLNRRGALRIGALSIGTALMPKWALAGTESVEARETSCIFVLLQGGPSHIDLWDPKPNAGSDVRGPFAPQQTNVPDVWFTEMVPGMASQADRLAVIRSMTHPFANHIAGTYIALTGSYNQQDRDREAHGDDFPGPGPILQHVRPRESAIPVSISLPNWLSIPGPSNRMPGQYGGFLGSVLDPFVLEGNPETAGYDPLGLQGGSSIPIERLSDRRSLLEHLDHSRRWLDREISRSQDRYMISAMELVSSDAFRGALDLSRETDAVRDRYGRNRLGQSFLLARRLIEVGVRWISVNEFNQTWDTHGDLERRYQQIVPPLDRAYSALVADLHERGLNENCVVALGGEFGRTPKINDQAGRDHWPNAYSYLLSGGRVQGGRVWGATDASGSAVDQTQ